MTAPGGAPPIGSRECDAPMRDGGCTMDPGHRGRHSTVTFGCDVCGRQRRGRGYPIMARISHYETEHVGDICFMCKEGIGNDRREDRW